jgi:hypothetical protein
VYQVVFAMLTTRNQTLDPLYTSQYPVGNKMLNIPVASDGSFYVIDAMTWYCF